MSPDKAPPAWTLSVGQKAGEMLRQMVLIQDLLLSPFTKGPQARHQELLRCSLRQNTLVWWEQGGVLICILAIHSWISKAVRVNPGPCPPSKALLPASEALLGIGVGSWSADFSSVLSPGHEVLWCVLDYRVGFNGFSLVWTSQTESGDAEGQDWPSPWSSPGFVHPALLLLPELLTVFALLGFEFKAQTAR